MAKNKNEQKGEEMRRKGEPRPKEPWFPTKTEKEATNDKKIGWDRENARREKRAKR